MVESGSRDLGAANPSDWPQGDIRATVAALAAELAGFRFPDTAPWWTELRWAGIGGELIT